MKRTPKVKRPSKRQVAILSVILGVVIIASTGVYFYIAGMASDANRRLEESKKSLAESQQLATRLAKSQADFKATQAQLASLEQSMPTRAYVPTFLKQLEDLAARCNSTVIGIRPAEPAPEPVKKPEPEAQTANTPSSAAGANPDLTQKSDKVAGIDYDTQDFAIDIQGKYWDLVRFMDGLNGFPKIVAVRSINVSPGGASVSGKLNHSLTLRIQLTAYLLKEGGDGNGRG